MRPLIRPAKLGSTNTDEWIKFQLRKCSEEQKAQSPFQHKECRIYLTPKDEENLRIEDLRKRRESKESLKESTHKQTLAEIYAMKDKEMEDRRKRYIETGSYD